MTLRIAIDFISPYAHLAWHALPRLAAKHAVTIEPLPVLFGAMLDHHGHLGPAEIPAKRRLLITDVARSARSLGLELGLPPRHPFNPLLALRVSCLEMSAATRHALITALFAEVWGPNARGVTDPDVVAEVCDELGVNDAAARASTPKIKQIVRENTQWAIEHGAFGVPSVWSGGTLFWGYDTFDHLDEHLGGADRVDPALVRAWETLPGTHRPQKG